VICDESEMFFRVVVVGVEVEEDVTVRSGDTSSNSTLYFEGR
jgi:hypothetical protein